MFKCKGCEALQDEVKHLREINIKLLGTITALQSPQAFHLMNPPESQHGFYGDGQDQYVTHDQFGAPVLIEKDITIEGT